jgi:hypothetical protein
MKVSYIRLKIYDFFWAAVSTARLLARPDWAFAIAGRAACVGIAYQRRGSANLPALGFAARLRHRGGVRVRFSLPDYRGSVLASTIGRHLRIGVRRHQHRNVAFCCISVAVCDVRGSDAWFMHHWTHFALLTLPRCWHGVPVVVLQAACLVLREDIYVYISLMSLLEGGRAAWRSRAGGWQLSENRNRGGRLARVSV